MARGWKLYAHAKGKQPLERHNAPHDAAQHRNDLSKPVDGVQQLILQDRPQLAVALPAFMTASSPLPAASRFGTFHLLPPC